MPPESEKAADSDEELLAAVIEEEHARRGGRAACGAEGRVAEVGIVFAVPILLAFAFAFAPWPCDGFVPISSRISCLPPESTRQTARIKFSSSPSPICPHPLSFLCRRVSCHVLTILPNPFCFWSSLDFSSSLSLSPDASSAERRQTFGVQVAHRQSTRGCTKQPCLSAHPHMYPRPPCSRSRIHQGADGASCLCDVGAEFVRVLGRRRYGAFCAAWMWWIRIPGRSVEGCSTLAAPIDFSTPNPPHCDFVTLSSHRRQSILPSRPRPRP
ncbi:hypothetical protein K438DRAFT_649167 [Mycena galopus ATCC 62051]|nr:hypothetical protein K438DRAFT_649167 [Mycena galopus ATCC 62051]